MGAIWEAISHLKLWDHEIGASPGTTVNDLSVIAGPTSDQQPIRSVVLLAISPGNDQVTSGR